jgi:hypothetical protein
LYTVDERPKRAIAIMPTEYWFGGLIVGRANSWLEWKKVDD